MLRLVVSEVWDGMTLRTDASIARVRSLGWDDSKDGCFDWLVSGHQRPLLSNYSSLGAGKRCYFRAKGVVFSKS